MYATLFWLTKKFDVKTKCPHDRYMQSFQLNLCLCSFAKTNLAFIVVSILCNNLINLSQ
jgi:hypothetical protein